VRSCRLFTARARLGEQRGFTLVELLVTILILGLLAAIAYAIFLGQRTKAHDAKAKDDVAALGVDIESCFTDDQTYAPCVSADALGEKTLPIQDLGSVATDCTMDPGPTDTYNDPDPGNVAILATSVDCYLIESASEEGNLFWILKRSGNAATRGCVRPGVGGCQSTGDPDTGSWNKD